MVILVTGANGQLGNEMRIVAHESEDEYIFADVVSQEGKDTTFLDITDLTALRSIVDERGVDVIVNCAAYTNVDGAETNVDQAELLNSKAPFYLAEVMKERGGLLIHISTDYVFGGQLQNVPYTEEHMASPTSCYGRTKYQGEEAIRRSGCHYVILRTAWLYSEFGKNFLKTMLTLTATRDRLNVVFDQVGTPTYALDLACAITAVMADYSKWAGETTDASQRYPKEGIYHFTDEGVCSWYDFALTIAAMAGHDGCDIQPCHSNEYPSPVARPAYSVLDKTKIKETFGICIPHWTTSLQSCMKRL